jgi:N-acetyl-anhydromuramyl-L-alanine amidase AmpD
MIIDTTTYEVKGVNLHKTHCIKTQIIIAMSLRKNSYHIIRLKNKEFGNSKKWNTYTISRDGTIYQHYDPKFHTDFLGIKEADKQSISIVLENMGCLFRTSTNKYINWLNEECDKKNVVAFDYMGYNFWEQYSNEQIESTVQLCKKLCEDFNIPNTSMEFFPYHKDTIKFKGIVFRSNHIEDSSDINPLFNIDKFNEMLHNEFV